MISVQGEMKGSLLFVFLVFICELDLTDFSNAKSET